MFSIFIAVIVKEGIEIPIARAKTPVLIWPGSLSSLSVMDYLMSQNYNEGYCCIDNKSS